ncbi:hypothetical protein NPX13_g10646 [Xylaria arbuscula]|uniref:Protein-S-isoprenylcysteine O-methyltransferase n=1 Tax=Xylaria arbuscula TaxID=114810 RepID=A0A9W8N4E0_9PEZI|nr:hypothetical protein NPX13_g10646 [Xylaria arbuscula]
MTYDITTGASYNEDLISLYTISVANMVFPVSIPKASLATAIGLSAAGIWMGTSKDMFWELLYARAPATDSKDMSSELRSFLNKKLLTPEVESKDTAIPITLILAGASLRLLAYSGLGTNFTYGLAEPDQLKTTGVYRYIQHPSYTGALALAAGALGLWWRADGILSCFIPPRVFPVLKSLEPVMLGLALASIATAAWKRVRDEEAMLHREFGKKWEDWHSRTARFIPFIF